MSRKKIALIVGGCLFTVLALLVQGTVAVSIAGLLLLGWAPYLYRVLSQATVSGEGAATALVSLALFTLGLHAFMRWFHREVQRQSRPSEPQCHPWPLRRTVSLVLVVLVMFVAGLAATGVVHQAGWILKDKDAWASVRRDVHLGGFGDTSKFHLGAIGMNVLNYASVHHRLPTTRYDGEHEPARALQSWQTALLPYMPLGALTAGMIDLNQPWNAPRNSACFRGIVPDFLNPEIVPIRSPEGYALSHYAGNRHVLGSRRPLPFSETSQGGASLILAGEVAAGFKPWGDPANLRDPIQGTKGTPEAFGNPSMTGASFLFGDGSVRFLSRTTSPQVLARFSIPSRHPGDPPNPGRPDKETALEVPNVVP